MDQDGEAASVEQRDPQPDSPVWSESLPRPSPQPPPLDNATRGVTTTYGTWGYAEGNPRSDDYMGSCNDGDDDDGDRGDDGDEEVDQETDEDENENEGGDDTRINAGNFVEDTPKPTPAGDLGAQYPGGIDSIARVNEIEDALKALRQRMEELGEVKRSAKREVARVQWSVDAARAAVLMRARELVSRVRMVEGRHPILTDEHALVHRGAPKTVRGPNAIALIVPDALPESVWREGLPCGTRADNGEGYCLRTREAWYKPESRDRQRRGWTLDRLACWLSCDRRTKGRDGDDGAGSRYLIDGSIDLLVFDSGSVDVRVLVRQLRGIYGWDGEGERFPLVGPGLVPKPVGLGCSDPLMLSQEAELRCSRFDVVFVYTCEQTVALRDEAHDGV